MGFAEATLRAVIADYEDGKRELLARRDAQLRAFHANGWRPVDLQRVTGYSRETIRHALHPEVRRATNASRRKADRGAEPRAVAAALAPPQGGYGDRKPYVVADNLEDLRGPTKGTITLPHHLDWSGQASYDLDRPARLATMYRTVLNEASTAQDLRNWLNARILTELWPTLWLPARLRGLWEGRFPQLATDRPAVA
ncbi:MAG: hypothetical protein ACM30G_00695 [Micromonosporaceae bacterium]